MTIHNFQFNSSMLSDCSYDSEANKLTVTFNNGRSYTYTEVPYNTYVDLTNAKSSGQYFNSIKKNLKLKEYKADYGTMRLEK